MQAWQRASTSMQRPWTGCWASAWGSWKSVSAPVVLVRRRHLLRTLQRVTAKARISTSHGVLQSTQDADDD